MTLAIVVAFFAIALLGVPLAFALGASAVVGLTLSDLPFDMMGGKLVFSINSFPLMAIPFFMLVGELMVRGGIIQRLIGLADTIVGRMPGGIAQVAVGSGLGLASVSGAAIADAAALSSMLMRPMGDLYGRPFSAAVIAATANLGPIIPPSTAMIIYAFLAGPGVSIAGLFLAGVVPGLIIAAAMMGLISWIARSRKFPRSDQRFSGRAILREGRRTIVVLLLPIVVIGGIIGGAFTATEGGAVGVVMALFMGFFVTRELKLSDLPDALLNAAITTAVLGTVIAFASTVTFLFTAELIPQQIGDWLRALTDDPTLFLLILMAILVVVGMFIEPNAAYVMLVPIFAPLAVVFHVDPLHFAMLFILNLVVGMLTPPIGTLLFVMCSMTGLRIGEIFKEVWPFALLQYGVVVLVLFVPDIVLWLPRWAGY